MKIVLIGYGKMGHMVETEAMHRGHTIVGVMGGSYFNSELIEQADLCIDFSHPLAVVHHVREVARLGKPIVMGTTGWDQHIEEIRACVEHSEIGFIYGPNFSIGVNLFFEVLREAARRVAQFSQYDVAVQEAHHRHKVDSPSGTAKAIAQILVEASFEEPEITSTRCGAIPGTHTVVFDTEVDTLSFTHTARTREGFAQGAVAAAEWVLGKKGFYTFSDMFREEKK